MSGGVQASPGARRTLQSAPAFSLVLAGFALLPWNIQDPAFQLSHLLAMGADSVDQAAGIAQATRFSRWWLWPVVVTAILVCAVALMPIDQRRRSFMVIVLGGAGIAAFIAQALAIGLRGWNAAWLEALFGPLDQRQLGVGLGAASTFVGLILLTTDAIAARGMFRGDRFISGLVGLLVFAIIAFTVWPLLRLFAEAFKVTGDAGLLGTFAERLLSSRIWGLACLTTASQCGAAINTVMLAVATATTTTALGLCFALIVTRTNFRARAALRFLTVLPIITPPFVIGLGLILIFGRSGVFNQVLEAMTGWQAGRWIYGFQGVWLAQVFSFTPTAFLVLIGVVEGLSPTLEEASQTLRASLSRTFNTVTLPLMRPGLANAALVVFIESIADFGNPILLGGSYGVLSTEVYFAVVGAQADFGRAATLALVLLLIALSAFLLQRFVVGRKSYVSMTGKGDTGLPQPLPTGIRRIAFAIAMPWAVLTMTVYVMALAGAFVKTWGRDWTPTLSHFARAFAIDHGRDGSLILAGGAWRSLFTTIELAAVCAPITAAIGLLAAWLLTRQRFAGRGLLEFALMLTFAVPGTVIGVAYILTYNVPPLEITGTALILVLCIVFRNLPVGVRSGIAGMSQLDKSLDEASLMLRATSGRTFARVVLPLLKPAIITALIYSFVRAMTTVSAIIFLVSAEYEMATVFIINRAVNGDYGVAIAYSATLIVIMVLAIALIALLVGRRRLGRRTAGTAAGVSRIGAGARA